MKESFCVHFLAQRGIYGMLRRRLMATLQSLNFDNLALRSLPIDKERENSIRQVEDACFTLVTPTPVTNPRLVAYSLDALALLDLPQAEVTRPDFTQYFSGSKILPGSQTAAHCYCGHQSGYFSGQLGDGAAMYLGEVLNTRGERWEIQLKGAGLTPFSNHRDGRKVLRSSIREFLCSEAMFYLGIPTTRAGCCVTSDTIVARDKDYNGKTVDERASLVLRMSPTFLRFGSFEIFKPADHLTGYSGPSVGRTDLLHQLLDYTIKNFFPEIYRDHENPEGRYLAFYEELTVLTARLVAQWQCIGFCHGVLNTDNMSIVGLTIDYGPFGFLDFYDPNYLSQSSDVRRRNSVKQQPELCKWNLLKLAEAIQDALPLEKSTTALEELFDGEFQRCFFSKMKRKLGLLTMELPTDIDLIKSLFDTMEQTAADFTNTFRCLSNVTPTNCTVRQRDEDVVDYLVSQCLSLQGMIKACSVNMEWSQMLEMARNQWKSSPNVVLQMEKESDKYQLEDERCRKKVQQLKLLTQEQKEAKDRKLLDTWIRTYKARLDQEYDQQNADEMNEERVKTMKSNNPRFVLRNYIAQSAIEAAEKGDYSVVQDVLKRLKKPYCDNIDAEEYKPAPMESKNRSSSSKPAFFNLKDSKTLSHKPTDDFLNLRLS